ncbi:hypothetical protein H8A97_32540 [Bradyrhizobium sp. Arg62]|uniref:hypothetical protein n=1 Tax=Bradyrhizobium brasilense TaxID=1419277 RepID=UPI001E316E4A|nr:hypothetical protein [Bradyrhizobium brasilense]MCC8949696.1 hypothetical protein [Bradyrhizobium brasilense]
MTRKLDASRVTLRRRAQNPRLRCDDCLAVFPSPITHTQFRRRRRDERAHQTKIPVLISDAEVDDDENDHQGGSNPLDKEVKVWRQHPEVLDAILTGRGLSDQGPAPS